MNFGRGNLNLSKGSIVVACGVGLEWSVIRSSDPQISFEKVALIRRSPSLCM